MFDLGGRLLAVIKLTVTQPPYLMDALNPQYFWLLLLAVLAVLLYVFRRKSRRVNVSTMVFFKTLAKEHQESAWLRRLKKWCSFAMTLLVILAAIFSLARLVPNESGDYRTYVILLDRSASMALPDNKGETRLEKAKQLIRSRLSSIPEDAGVALIAYDNRPEVIQPRTLIRRECLSRLDQVKIRPIAGDSDTGFELATMLAELKKPALVLHAGDSQDTNPTELPDSIEVESINVALANPINVGVTSFQIRKTPLEQDSYDVHARVAMNQAAPQTQDVKLELYVGGVPSQVRNFELDPGEGQTFEFRVRGAGGQILRMHIETEGDQFELDDDVIAPLPKSRPIVAVWIRENSENNPQDAYTNLALRAIQESETLELLAGTPDQWPLKYPVDAVIFDGWLPDLWPKEIPAIVLNPPKSAGPVLARALSQPIPYDSIRVANDQHPILFRVNSGRISLAQTSIFQPAGSFEPLWIAGKEPVLAAGEVDGQRLVVMAFSPKMSERLPLTASFPLLLGNSLLWAVEGSESIRNQVQNASTGEIVELAEGENITWTHWENDRLRKQVFPLESNTLEMEKIGIWQTDNNQLGASHLLSTEESDLPGLDDSILKTQSQSGERSGRIGLGNLLRCFLVLIVAILMIESWLFHRFAVY